MTLQVGHVLAVRVEKPAAGGRMIARVDGQVALVAGAIPGEVVEVRVERLAKHVAHAQTVAVLEPSADRRPPTGDPSCGGCAYAHVAYARQLALKGEIVADAFARIARLPLAQAVDVAASREEGYRMRARLHARASRIGFFREGTHDLCDVRQTRQLLAATCDALDRAAAMLRSFGTSADAEIDLSENVDASERVIQVETSGAADARALRRIESLEGFTRGPFVTDVLQVADGAPMRLRRHVLAFFQGNRYVLPDLVSHVVARLPRGGRVADLYAGAGLFSVGAAIAADARVTAVEGDRHASADLAANAAQARGAVTVVHMPVEQFVGRPPAGAPPDAVIVDPPRTGVSREALDGISALRAPRIVYVSCDVATLARDARRLVDAGYRLDRIDAFDMFPNTAHVETVAVFQL